MGEVRRDGDVGEGGDGEGHRKVREMVGGEGQERVAMR